LLSIAQLAHFTSVIKGAVMSGSGGGGGGGSFYDGPIECEKLVFDTQLSSPKEDVVKRLTKGMELEVSSQTMNGAAVVVVLHQGDIAGGLASPALTRLRQCMAGGTSYKAAVLEVNDGQVRVRVRPA
jgi:hypothetical protein